MLTSRQKRNKKIGIFRAISDKNLLKEPKEALKLVDEYLTQIDKNDVDCLLLKGNIFESMGEGDRAVEILGRILKVEPRNILALIDTGDYYFNYSKEYEKALKYYHRAMQLGESGHYYKGLYSYFDKNAAYIRACQGKADTLLELKKPVLALKCIVRGLQKYPEDILLGAALQRAQELNLRLQEVKFGKKYLNIKKDLMAQVYKERRPHKAR